MSDLCVGSAFETGFRHSMSGSNDVSGCRLNWVFINALVARLSAISACSKTIMIG